MLDVLPVLQERVTEWHWEMHPVWWMWGAGGLVMMLMVFVFWGLVIVALVSGIRWLTAQRQAPRHDSALAILRERHARGEINREEFEARRKGSRGLAPVSRLLQDSLLTPVAGGAGVEGHGDDAPLDEVPRLLHRELPAARVELAELGAVLDDGPHDLVDQGRIGLLV